MSAVPMRANNYEGYPWDVVPFRDRFISVWQRLLVQYQDLADVESIWHELDRRYSEPARAYHTFEHLARCFRELDRARTEMRSPDRVELALWFHDAIYRPEATG
jgi:predicted metal-dependent HD superfamily phosphohydrolase